MDKFHFFQTDCDSILSEIRDQEKQLKLKRRWLLGLPTAGPENKSSRTPEFVNNGYLAESLLREDDLAYETIVSHVEEAFGIHNAEKGCDVAENYEQSSSHYGVFRALSTRLDALTNKGLYLVAMILTQGSIKFAKTRPRMKEIIRDYLLKFSGNRKNFCGQKEILSKLSKVLRDPRNFKRKCVGYMTPMIRSHQAAAAKVLDELESLSSEALIAMRRKLQCKRWMPQSKPYKSGRSRSEIIHQVRETSLRMLLDSGVDDQMPEPLAKAMAIADLSLRLKPEHQNISVGDFYPFSTEIRHLQNEIVKAIWLISSKVRFPELKLLQLLLDPEAKVSNVSLRTAIKKLLTEYLFECSDMDVIPKSLLEALAVVNRCSQSVEPKNFAREEVNEDVERILSVSAEMKQIAWDFINHHELDQDFADAYREELEDSDDDSLGGLCCDYGGTINTYGHDENDNASVKVEWQSSISQSPDSDFERESMGETIPVESRTPVCITGGLAQGVQRDCLSDTHSTPQNITAPSLVPQAFRPLNTTQSSEIKWSQVKIEEDETKANSELDCKTGLKSHLGTPYGSNTPDLDLEDKCEKENKYLLVQRICDKTSMAAYNLIGHLLEKFAEEKGLDLDWNSRIYLGDISSAQDDNRDDYREQDSSEESLNGSVDRMVREPIPSLDKRKIGSLEELMDAL